MDHRAGEQRHERGLHVGPHDQGNGGRQQRDVVGGDQRIELHRALAQDDLGEGRKAIGIGVGLLREIHQADVGGAQQLLDLVGVGREDEDGGIGRAGKERAGIAGKVLADEGRRLLVDHAVGAQQLTRDGPRPAVQRPDHDALAFEVAQRRNRQVAAREYPHRLVHEPAEGAQLGVFDVAAFLLFGCEASLQAADEATLHEPCRDPSAVVGERAQRDAALQRAYRRFALGIGDPRGSPYLDLDPVFAQLLLVAARQLGILGVARRNHDLAFAVVPLRIGDGEDGAHADAGGEHRRGAGLGEIRIHALPLSSLPRMRRGDQPTGILEHPGRRPPRPDGGPVAAGPSYANSRLGQPDAPLRP